MREAEALSLLSDLTLALKVKRAKDALEKESRMGEYDVKITLAKGAGSLAMGAAMACIPVLTAYFSDPVIVGAALTAAGLKPAIVSAVSIALVAVAKMLSNYSKNS
jgi:hypothetical protein